DSRVGSTLPGSAPRPSTMSHQPPRIEDAIVTRRELLCRSGMRMGALALGNILAEKGLLGQSASAEQAGGADKVAVNPLEPNPSRSTARAKRVVNLSPNGGPSHVDTFDPKPALDRYNGKPVPTNLPTERKTGAAMGSPFKFQKYGQSGIE